MTISVRKQMRQVPIGHIGVLRFDQYRSGEYTAHTLFIRESESEVRTLVDSAGDLTDEVKSIATTSWSEGVVHTLTRQDSDICHVLATHGLPGRAHEYALERAIACETTMSRLADLNRERPKLSGSLT